MPETPETPKPETPEISKSSGYVRPPRPLAELLQASPKEVIQCLEDLKTQLSRALRLLKEAPNGLGEILKENEELKEEIEELETTIKELRSENLELETDEAESSSGKAILKSQLSRIEEVTGNIDTFERELLFSPGFKDQIEKICRDHALIT